MCPNGNPTKMRWPVHYARKHFLCFIAGTIAECAAVLFVALVPIILVLTLPLHMWYRHHTKYFSRVLMCLTEHAMSALRNSE